MFDSKSIYTVIKDSITLVLLNSNCLCCMYDPDNVLRLFTILDSERSYECIDFILRILHNFTNFYAKPDFDKIDFFLFIRHPN